MQALQRTFQTIAAQLQGLAPTAKLLIGSIMIILVMSLYLVWLFAGRQAMAPLGLKATLSHDARARAISYLESRNIPYQDRAGEVLVPIEQKYTVLAQLTEGQLISPEQINFETLMSDDSPFRTRDQNRQRYLVAKMNVLATMIGQMSNIHRASVVLDQPEGHAAIAKAHIGPTASVTVLTRGGELSQTQVDAIAQLVAGSHAGLKPQNVAVIDARTSRALQARTDDVLNSGRYMEVKRDAEQHVKSTLEGMLSYISGVRIAVNAQVDTKEVVQQTTKHGEPKIGVLSESSRLISSTNNAASAEPGVKPNTGMSVMSGGRGGSQLTDERSDVATIPAFDKTNSQIRNTTNYALKINATVGVPKSYFVRLFQDRQGNAGAAPEASALDEFARTEIEQLRAFITPLIDTSALENTVAGTVVVSMIPDFGAAAANMLETKLDSGSFASGSANDGLVKYVSLGTLAALSLIMMFMIVRKAGSREPLPTAAELVGIPPALAAADGDLVGEADEASPALEGLELNDEAIRRQQMLEQITDMVHNSGDEAANLLRRWIKSEA